MLFNKKYKKQTMRALLNLQKLISLWYDCHNTYGLILENMGTIGLCLTPAINKNVQTVRINPGFTVPIRIVNIQLIKSLAPGRCGCYFKSVIFILIPTIDILNSSCEIALRGIPQDLADYQSPLVQVMAWRRQAQFLVFMAKIPSLCVKLVSRD